MTVEAIGVVDAIQSSLRSEVIATKPIQADFESLIINKVDNINESLAAADKVLQDLALNKPVNAHDVMLAMQQAKSDLRMAVEVRNKLLEGYQEIMRMQV